MSNITLTDQNHESNLVFTFGNCGFSRVYLEGLKEGELLVSDQPFLIQNTNGIIPGIDERFTIFKRMKNNQVLETIQVQWRNSCIETTEVATDGLNSTIIPKNWIQVLGIPTLLLILSFGFAFFIYRVKK